MTKVIFEYNGLRRRVLGWKGTNWEVRIPYRYLEDFE